MAAVWSTDVRLLRPFRKKRLFILARSQCGGKRIKALQEAMNVFAGILYECVLTGFLPRSCELRECYCVSLPVLYCYDIRNDINMSEVRYKVSLHRPPTLCMGTGKDVNSGPTASEKPLKDTFMIINRCMPALKKGILKFWAEKERAEKGKVDSARRLVKTYSLSHWSIFLEELTSSPVVESVSITHCSHLSRCTTCSSAQQRR